jgi:hypothetical protein
VLFAVAFVWETLVAFADAFFWMATVVGLVTLSLIFCLTTLVVLAEEFFYEATVSLTVMFF